MRGRMESSDTESVPVCSTKCCTLLHSPHNEGAHKFYIHRSPLINKGAIYHDVQIVLPFILYGLLTIHKWNILLLPIIDSHALNKYIGGSSFFNVQVNELLFLNYKTHKKTTAR